MCIEEILFEIPHCDISFLYHRVQVSKGVILGCRCQNAQNKCIQNPLSFEWACSRYIQFLRRLHLQESSNE